MINSIAKLIKGLNDNSHPGEMAHAVSCGLLLGFLPKDNLLWYSIFIIFLFLRINKGAFFLCIIGGSLLAPLIDPLFHTLGYYLLTIDEISPYMAAYLNIPMAAYTKINNTIVAGSLVFSILGYLPFYLVARLFVRFWRKKISPALANNKLVKGFVNIPIVNHIYSAYKKIGSFYE